MKAETINLQIEGTRRLIMHSSRLADPLDPITKNLARLTSKRMKTEADHEAISKAEWFGGLWLDGGVPCVPAEALMATFVGAARSRRRGAQAGAGMMVGQHAELDYDGPRDLEKLWEAKPFRLRVPVRVGNARPMRTRPKFDRWSIRVAVSYLPTVVNRDEVIETFAIAGFMKGLGDWRPQNGNFSVTVVD